MRKLIACASLTLATVGMSATAFAGEVTGGRHPKTTPVNSYIAQSICSFSGLEDGITLLGFNPDGTPILVFDTPTGPGYVQTPHMENGAGVIHEPGVAGDSCRGNATSNE
jgi:hypothetical protein